MGDHKRIFASSEQASLTWEQEDGLTFSLVRDVVRVSSLWCASSKIVSAVMCSCKLPRSDLCEAQLLAILSASAQLIFFKGS